MAETATLFATLKAILKSEDKTYADVAEVLHLSEASVKQMFRNQRMTIERLDIICTDLLGMEISDLVELMQERGERMNALDEAMEQKLVSDVRLLLVAVHIMNGWTANEIVHVYLIDRAECQRHLAVLEQLELISLRRNGSIKLLVDRNFQWLPNGPIQRYFQGYIQDDFLAADFNAHRERLVFLTGAMSDKSAEEMMKGIEKLAAEFIELNERDTRLPLQERLGNSMIIAMRPWLLRTFADLKRES